jgi:hypothetical protein
VKPKPRSTACERARATALHETPRNALRGDVDGDGNTDAVSLVRVQTAPDRCLTFLVVRTRSRTLARPVQGDRRLAEVPRLNGLASIGPGRLDIVVTTWQGAATAGARVFSVGGGRITPLAAPTSDGTFPYEGSVIYFNGVDCVRPAENSVVASGYLEKGATGPPFGFERRFYRVHSDRFVPVRTQTGITRTNLALRNPMHEFREPQPFPSCMRVRAQ